MVCHLQIKDKKKFLFYRINAINYGHKWLQDDRITTILDIKDTLSVVLQTLFEFLHTYS